MEYSISKDEIIVLQEFLTESEDHLDGIEGRILKLEESKDIDLVNSIFRPIHTVKGTSSFLNLVSVGKLSHEVETLLDEIRKEKIKEINSEIIDVLLESVDIIARMLDAVRDAIAEADLNSDPIKTEIEDVDYQEILQRVVGLRSTGGQKSLSDDKESVKENIGQESKNSSDSISFPKEMKAQFIQEGNEHLDISEDILLNLESNRENRELYNDLFRSLHSIKGNTGVILSLVEDEEKRKSHFLNKFRELAHKAESLVQMKRDGQELLEGKHIDLLLRVKDTLAVILDSFTKGQNYDIDISLFISEIDSALNEESKGQEIKFEELKDVGGDALALAVSNSLAQGLSAIEMGLEELGDEEKAQKALKKMKRSYNNLKKIGEKISNKPLVEKSTGSLSLVEFLLLGDDENKELFIAELKKDFEFIKENADRRKKEGNRDRRKKTLPPKDEENKKQPSSTKPKTSIVKSTGGEKIVKVAQEKIDVFMNLIGELLVSKNNLNALSALAAKENNGYLVQRLKESSEMIARISEELQSNIMNIRMLPVGNAFSKFPRMIRDLSRKLNKKIRLEISGEETEIDKNIIEGLSDPLVHMIRNSADHGIEMPEERKAKGKNEEGVVRLKAFNQGQYVVIQIEDDGKGIDVQTIRLKLLQKGLYNELELENMNDRSVLNCIFMPGFSMAKKVTDVSGRGVGMDVVKTNLEKLGGEVSVESTIDKGSIFTLKLPLTMAIGRGLEISVGKNRFYLPLEYIEETIKVKKEDVYTYKGKEMTVIRGNITQVYRLSDLLDLESTSKTSKEEAFSVVVADVKGIKRAIIVDNYYNEGEYVIKPLTGSISNIDGISGAMITGEGSIHLILDPQKLF